MRKNIARLKNFSFLLIMCSLVCVSLISCAGPGVEQSCSVSPPEEVAAPIEHSPEAAAETVAPIEDFPESVEEVAVLIEDYPAPSEEVAAPVEDIPEPAAEAVAPSEDSPEPVEEVAAPIKDLPAPSEEVAAPIKAYPAPSEELAAPVEDIPEVFGGIITPIIGSEVPVDGMVVSANGDAQPVDLPSEKLNDYTVALGADKQMKIPGLPGELRVWIGSSKFKPEFPTRMGQDETTIPAEGEWATVEPFAPAFEIDPPETECIKIHPSGSVVRFKLTAKKAGTFDVGANVYLFDAPDCSGAPIPKTAATLKVTVEVDRKEIFSDKGKDLWNVFWQELLEFWAALVALIFGLFLFLVRGKLKKWFGFEQE
ncbi:MAG: hypothetical protein KQH63_19535 [Desulfobulbaceae bacterium]|nr:hypothetical protein [Desulfobulbaceae bacterium]